MAKAYKCDICNALTAVDYPIFLPDKREVFIGNEMRDVFWHINICADCALEIQNLFVKRSVVKKRDDVT